MISLSKGAKKGDIVKGVKLAKQELAIRYEKIGEIKKDIRFTLVTSAFSMYTIKVLKRPYFF